MTVLRLRDYRMNDRSRVAASHVRFERGGARSCGPSGLGVIKPMVGPARGPDEGKLDFTEYAGDCAECGPPSCRLTGWVTSRIP